MHAQDIFRSTRTTFSFEFFPPKSPEAVESLYETIRELEAYQPHFVSVTYGAGGSTRELTHDLVVRIKQTTSLDPVPHLTCVCHKQAEIGEILERYARAGVSNILSLGGDAPKGQEYRKANDDFQHAVDLVRFIRKFNESGGHPDGRGFGIGVAGFPEGHPATPNRLLEMDYLKQKVDAGADYIVTQLFFDNRDFLDFRDRCELAGINVPIVAGIMPVTSIAGNETHGRPRRRCAVPGQAPARLAALPGRSGKRRACWRPSRLRTVPRPARAQGARDSLLHVESFRRDPTDIR